MTIFNTNALRYLGAVCFGRMFYRNSLLKQIVLNALEANAQQAALVSIQFILGVGTCTLPDTSVWR